MGPEWHGHVTALTVAPEYRRLGLARKMMHLLELVSDEIYKAFFVDLYVRCANKVAIEMYEGMGYSVYRRVREYYGSLGVGRGGRDEEDALGEFLFNIFCSLSPVIRVIDWSFATKRYAETAFEGCESTFGPAKRTGRACQCSRSFVGDLLWFVLLSHRGSWSTGVSQRGICIYTQNT